MTSTFTERLYGKNWLAKRGPQTREQLIEGFRETFVADLATQAVDNLFKSEHLIADNDGMIHWAETYKGRPTNGDEEGSGTQARQD